MKHTPTKKDLLDTYQAIRADSEASQRAIDYADRKTGKKYSRVSKECLAAVAAVSNRTMHRWFEGSTSIPGSAWRLIHLVTFPANELG